MQLKSYITFNHVTHIEELQQLQGIAEQIWHEHYTAIIGKDQVNYMLSKFQTVAAMKTQIEQGYRYDLVLDDDQIIGYTAAVASEHYYYISKFYLVQAARGKGYAKLMLAHIEELAQLEGFSKLRLNVNKYNDHSIAAYKRLGFVVIGEEKNDIGEGFFMDDYVMEKHLQQ